MNKLVCVTGMPGAGKSVFSDYFVEKGYQFVRFGQITLDEVKKKGLKPNEKNERKIREAIRKKHGMAAYAILNYPKFKKLLKKGNVIADGLYSWAEFKYLKKKFKDQMIVVAIFAPPKLRHTRISKRVMPKEDTDLRHRPFSIEEARKRDFAEIEALDKGGTIAMADYTLLNTGSMKQYKQQIIKCYKQIQ
jgi:dephospho-CoA kinase